MVSARLSADGHDIDCYRLSAAQVLQKILICTPAGGALLFYEEK